MDFLFNLISLLANLFSIEDHFKKDNDAKTVINNNYNFYVNNSSSHLNSETFNTESRNKQSVAVKYIGFWLFFCTTIHLLTVYLNFPSSPTLSNLSSTLLSASIHSILLFLILLVTVIVIRFINYFKKKLNFIPFLRKNISIILLTLNCTLLYLSATQIIGTFFQYIDNYVIGFMMFPLLSGSFYIYKYFVFSSQQFNKMTKKEKVSVVIFTLIYNLPLIALGLIFLLKFIFQK